MSRSRQPQEATLVFLSLTFLLVTQLPLLASGAVEIRPSLPRLYPPHPHCESWASLKEVLNGTVPFLHGTCSEENGTLIGRGKFSSGVYYNETTKLVVKVLKPTIPHRIRRELLTLKRSEVINKVKLIAVSFNKGDEPPKDDAEWVRGNWTASLIMESSPSLKTLADSVPTLKEMKDLAARLIALIRNLHEIAGVAHRDIKPSNILLRWGRPPEFPLQ